MKKEVFAELDVTNTHRGEFVRCTDTLAMADMGNIEAREGKDYYVSEVGDSYFKFVDESGDAHRVLFRDNMWFKKLIA